jgi:23S rRNA (guanosine2251-2'-O)-methyltransferase
MKEDTIQIEGRNPVIELLRSKRWINKVIIQQDINVDKKINEILKRADNRGVYISRKPRKYLDKISFTGSHQGVIARATLEQQKFADVIAENETHKKANNFVYIREALYESNVGAIARSAEAAGFSGIVLPPKTKVTATMFRTSMGAMTNLKIISASLFNAIKTAQKNLINVVAIERAENSDYYEIDLTGPTMFIIGGEDRELSQTVIDKCDAVASIPMQGKINSLNMSVAAAVVVFEKLRQEAKLEGN